MSQRNKKVINLILVFIMSVISINAQDEKPGGKPINGIRTDFGDVMIENLGIGRTYNLRELAGTPLKVTNTGINTINLAMDVVIPEKNMITTLRQEAGYKAIPSVDWVKLSQTQFIVPSGESAYSDVIINIPNDTKLYGKRFQASIYSRAIGEGALNLGVWSHLQLNIVRDPVIQAEIEKDRKKGVVGNMDYTLLPDKISIEKAPLGKKWDVKKENKKTIMIANSGETAIKLKAAIVPIGDTPLTLQTGYEEPKDLSWLQIKSNVYEVEPSSFVDPGFILSLPNDPNLKKKKLMFVLKVSPADPEVIGVTFYGKIYVEVAE